MRVRSFICGVLALAFSLTPMVGCSKDADRAPSGSDVARAATNAVNTVSVVADGEYTSRDQVAQYLRKFRRLPKNFITKAEARRLGWSGGPLEPYAPGKSIGGDRFGNYEGRLPRGRYKECDIDTRGRPRGTKRLVYSEDVQHIYYTSDHYKTFKGVP